MKRYGYHRTSTREQHLDIGIKEITAYCEQNSLKLEKIFTDQQTGKIGGFELKCEKCKRVLRLKHYTEQMLIEHSENGVFRV